MPSSGFATFSHPMSEGHLPLPRAKEFVRGGEGGVGAELILHAGLPLFQPESKIPHFMQR